MKMKIGSDTEKKHNYDTFQKHKNRQKWLLLEIGLQPKLYIPSTLNIYLILYCGTQN